MSPKKGVLCLAAAFLVSLGCSSHEAALPHGDSRPCGPRQAAAAQGFTSLLAVSGSGFLAENPSNKKRLMYLEGTHYEMGYQQGYMYPEAVRAMVHDYCDEILFEMLGLPFGSDRLGPLWSFVRAWLVDLVLASEEAVPTELRQEMHGIAAGYSDAVAHGRLEDEEGIAVTYEDVLLLNQGMDAISSLTYNALGKAGIACNQFACWGSRTRDGRLFHGRDFQFYTAGVYQDASLVCVYKSLGEDKNPSGYPFVTVTAPGFVGLATALNSQGISMGIDVVHSWASREGRPGLAGLLLIRRVMEQAGSLEEAVSIVREADRGCPWIYLVADGKEPSAVVLETLQSDAPEPWMQQRMEEAEAFARRLLGTPFVCRYPEKGLMVREADFVIPEDIRGKSVVLPGYCNNPKYEGDATFLNLDFPDTFEDLPDVIAATNHFLLPEMRPFQWAPLVSLIWRPYWPSTEWRYRTLVRLLLGRSTGGPSLDWEGAWATIDFLDPATTEGSFFHGPETDQEVGGHVALMDDQALILRALYGHYNDAWVEVSLGDFLDERPRGKASSGLSPISGPSALLPQRGPSSPRY
jgi:hypothetical protein